MILHWDIIKLNIGATKQRPKKLYELGMKQKGFTLVRTFLCSVCTPLLILHSWEHNKNGPLSCCLEISSHHSCK